MAVVSVVVPSLNVARYIEECIDSALNQTLRDIEIICVDAGSTDGTLEIIERKAREDSRIRIIKSDRRSYGYQMNLGFAAATGKYVAILESDDFVKPEAYGYFVSLAEKTGADLIKADYYIVLGSGENRTFRRMDTCRNRSDYGRCITPRDHLEAFNARMQTWQGIYRRSFIEKHDIRHNETPGASYQDNGFWFQTMMFADRLVFSPEAFYCLRRDNPASSMLQKGKVFCIFDEYEFIKGIVRRNPHLGKRLTGMFRKKEADNARAHFDRIAKESRREYLLRWQSVVKDAFDGNEYDRSLFSDGGWRAIETIRENPEWFFEADSVNDFPGLIKTKGNRMCVRARTRLERFRDCLRDNGWRYTVRHAFSKIRNRFRSDCEFELPVPPPLVSVVIPFCNCERYAAQTLSDICAQSYGNIEIVCVDDGSTDGTPGILESFAKKDARVKILRQGNGGAGKARNAGLAIAKGHYAAILDADDLYEKDMIEKAVRLACGKNAEIVVWRSDTYSEADGKFSPYPASIRRELLPGNEPFAAKDIRKDLFKAFVGWSWDKLFKLDYVRRLGIEFQEQRTSNDLFFVFSAIASAGRIATTDKVLVHHRRTSGTLSVTRERSWNCCFAALDKLRNYLVDAKLWSRFERDFVNYAVHFLLWNRNTLSPETRDLFDACLREWVHDRGIDKLPPKWVYHKSEYTALMSHA